MSQLRLEWKVGAFVFVALVLLAGLLVQFSKGTVFVTGTYEILLKTKNVGGIKKGAAVLMAGVPIGSVGGVELTPDGRDVLVRLRLLKQRTVRQDAVFTIEQAGFLGDQYVSVTPTRNTGAYLQEGALVTCEEPFNIQETARSAAGFLRRIDVTAQKLNDAVVRLDKTLLSDTNLSSITVAIENFKLLSEKALQTVESLDQVINTNAVKVAVGMSNLVEFSHQLNRIGADLHQTLITNREHFTATMKNMDSASGLVNDLLTNLQAGNGLAGSLLNDRQLQKQMGMTVSNMAVASSNLARFGLLYKPRPVKAGTNTSGRLYPGRR